MKGNEVIYARRERIGTYEVERIDEMQK